MTTPAPGADFLKLKGDLSAAVFSPCGLYRYRLERRWAWSSSGVVVWVMLNPSTADAEKNDPTVRKCIAFSKLWGFDGLTVVNLFALKATDPDELWRGERQHFDPVGPENDRVLWEAVTNAGIVIAAWGAHKAAPERGARVRAMMTLAGVDVYTLGRTKDGQPKHPLYLSLKTRPWDNKWA